MIIEIKKIDFIIGVCMITFGIMLIVGMLSAGVHQLTRIADAQTIIASPPAGAP